MLAPTDLSFPALFDGYWAWRSVMRRTYRSTTVSLACFVLALAALACAPDTLAQSASTDASDIARRRARLEGTFELTEWSTGGKVLRPPLVEGRFSIHDGVILFMTARKDGNVIVESVHGWGEYTIDARGWTYGYQHLESMAAGPDGRFTQTLRPPTRTLLGLAWEGEKLIVTGTGRDRRTYLPDEFVSELSGPGEYRRWRRTVAAQ